VYFACYQLFLWLSSLRANPFSGFDMMWLWLYLHKIWELQLQDSYKQTIFTQILKVKLDYFYIDCEIPWDWKEKGMKLFI